MHRILATACEAAGVRPVRGDDLFTPTDILEDIWQSINAADFVIADITGRNPNVLYELGIAHTLAKPVLILSKEAADIPIDLATRRVILYGRTQRPGAKSSRALSARPSQSHRRLRHHGPRPLAGPTVLRPAKYHSRRGRLRSVRQRARGRPFCAPVMGRPGLAPGRYFRLLLVGYFEGLDSERGSRGAPPTRWPCGASWVARA